LLVHRFPSPFCFFAPLYVKILTFVINYTLKPPFEKSARPFVRRRLYFRRDFSLAQPPFWVRLILRDAPPTKRDAIFGARKKKAKKRRVETTRRAAFEQFKKTGKFGNFRKFGKFKESGESGEF